VTLTLTLTKRWELSVLHCGMFPQTV
jgi:hypothetical protein